MTSVWITHGDSDDYYGIYGIYGVHATRELAVTAAEAYVRSRTGVTVGVPVIRLEWVGSKLNVFRGYPEYIEREPSSYFEAEISEHTIEGAAS